MSVKSAQAVTVLFATANATTGAAADATGTPTGTLYVNGTANGATVTVTNITTGVYKAALTLPSLTAGDVVSLRIAATVATVAGEGVVWQDTSDTKRTSDLQDVAATAIVSGGAITTSSGAVSAVTTVTNLTNAPTAGDLTATMKTSVTTAATAATPTAAAVTGAVGSVTGAVGSVTGNVAGSVASVTAGVTVTTNNDKTGYALSAGGVQAIWDALTSALITTGSIGKRIVDYLDAAVSSRSTYAGGDTSGVTTLLSRIVGTLASGTHNAQTGDAYARLGAPAGASVSADVAAVKTDTGAVKAKTDNLPASPAAVGSNMGTVTGVTGNVSGSVATVVGAVGSVTGAVGSVQSPVTVGANNDKTGYALTSAYDAAKTAVSASDVSTVLSNYGAPTLLQLQAEVAPLAVEANVETHASAALGAYDPPTKAELDTAVAALATAAALVTVGANASAAKAVTDKLDTALELDGAVYRYTINALEQAPAGGGGGGGTDWTADERQQIRHRLGVDGDVATPANNDPHLGTVNANVVQISGSALAADNLETYADGTLPFPAHVTSIRR